MAENILLIEDQPQFVVWASPLLNEIFPGHRIVHADSLQKTERILKQEHFSIIFIDINLPDGNGLSLLTQLKNFNPDARCIISSSHQDQDTILHAIQSGADGYIIKNGDVDNFKSILKKIKKGEPALSAPVSHTLIDYIQNVNTEDTATNLTIRQTEILVMLAKGTSTKDIATCLKLSIHTVTDHIKNMYKRLGIKSRAEAAVMATRMKLL